MAPHLASSYARDPRRVPAKSTRGASALLVLSITAFIWDGFYGQYIDSYAVRIAATAIFSGTIYNLLGF